MAYDERLASRVRGVLKSEATFVERKMFGGLAFMVRGHMAVGIIDDELMVRLGDAYEAGLLRPHTREMDFTGRPMKGYLYVEPDGVARDAQIKDWVSQAVAFVGTLPPKTRKTARKRR